VIKSVRAPAAQRPAQVQALAGCVLQVGLFALSVALFGMHPRLLSICLSAVHNKLTFSDGWSNSVTSFDRSGFNIKS
jgi:hypothetical protein